MGAFIGPLGNLIEATQWQEKQSVDTGAKPSFFTGLDGARTAFVQPPAGRVLREWDVSMSGARPEQAAAFVSLAMGGAGIGPFVFADPLAQVTNLLTPRESLMEPASLASTGAGKPRSNIRPAATNVPGFGVVPAGHVHADSSGFWGYRTPLHPDLPVTLSMLVQGPATVELRLMRDDSVWTSLHAESVTVDAVALQRVSVTAHPPFPVGAVMCGVRVMTTRVATIAQPQITWTAQPMPWAPGRGASQVVVHGLSESFEHADPSLCGMRLLDYSATVTEVGSGA